MEAVLSSNHRIAKAWKTHRYVDNTCSSNCLLY